MELVDRGGGWNLIKFQGLCRAPCFATSAVDVPVLLRTNAYSQSYRSRSPTNRKKTFYQLLELQIDIKQRETFAKRRLCALETHQTNEEG